MRLDKFLSDAGVATRTEIAKAAKSGQIYVNGSVERKAGNHIDPVKDEIVFWGKKVIYREFTYIMLNKPQGYISSTEDDRAPSVLKLLPEELQRIGLFPCGRLDKDTLGLIILTNNGPLSHKLLAPKNHVEKKYRFNVLSALSAEDIRNIEGGIRSFAPCKISMSDEYDGYITLTEGKYHEIKLMAESVNNKITYLERVSFGPIKLDTSLERGQWRYLTEEEQQMLESKAKSI